MKKLLVLVSLFTLFVLPCYSQTQGIKKEDTPHITGDQGVVVLFRRCDAANSSSGNDNDYTVPCVDDKGQLRVKLDGDINLGDVTIDVSTLAKESGGNLAAIKAKTDNIPAQGQALSSGSLPVVLPSSQITTLTPPAAITNYANETGGNLASIKSNTDKIPTSPSTSTKQSDGSQKTQIVDGSNNVIGSTANALDVNIKSGAGSGGTAAADDADFTAGSTNGTPSMGVYESSPSNVTDGDLGTVGITQKRALKVAVVNTSGTQLPDDSAVDAALNSGENPLYVGGVYESSPTVVESGDKASFHFDANQNLLIVGAVTATLATETTKVIGTVNIASSQTIGLATGSATIGAVTGSAASGAAFPANPIPNGVRADTTENSSVDDGDIVPAASDLKGRQVVILNSVFELKTSGNVTLNAGTEQDAISADANYKICITDITVFNADATNSEVVQVLDNGAIGTGTLMFYAAAPSLGGVAHTMTSPRCTSATNHKITIDSTGSANPVYVSIGGFKTAE